MGNVQAFGDGDTTCHSSYAVRTLRLSAPPFSELESCCEKLQYVTWKLEVGSAFITIIYEVLVGLVRRGA